VTVVRAQINAISRPQDFMLQSVQTCADRVDLLLNLEQRIGMRVRNGEMLNRLDRDENLACEINGLGKLRNDATGNLCVPSYKWILCAHDIRRERPCLRRPFRAPVGSELESTLFRDKTGQLTPGFIVSCYEPRILCGQLVDNFLHSIGILHCRSSRFGLSGGLVA
jgi:hypothetical protein